MSEQPRSLSGIKPTGTPHLGNYLGMIQPAIDLQNDFDSFYFVADFHALTTIRDPAFLKESTYRVTAYFLAFGLDPNKASFFKQSDVPEVTELTWLLSCVTNMGLLQRAHSYKAALDKGEGGTINHGVFTYPVLMASDILIYDSDVVPVGKDQVQHLEMARDMAVKFNQAFGGDFLKLPEARVKEAVQVVPGTDGRKMSKSYNNVIEPLLAPKKMRKQVMSIETDSTPMQDPLTTEGCTILALYKFFSTPEEHQQLVENYKLPDFGYGHAKQALFEKMNEAFEPKRERYEELMADHAYLDEVLAQGAKRARVIVADVMQRVRVATGLR